MSLVASTVLAGCSPASSSHDRTSDVEDGASVTEAATSPPAAAPTPAPVAAAEALDTYTWCENLVAQTDAYGFRTRVGLPENPSEWFESMESADGEYGLSTLCSMEQTTVTAVQTLDEETASQLMAAFGELDTLFADPDIEVNGVPLGDAGAVFSSVTNETGSFANLDAGLGTTVVTISMVSYDHPIGEVDLREQLTAMAAWALSHPFYFTQFGD